MLKRLDSSYQAGRAKGPWFKWKRDPMNADAVLMYAQRGHGKRSSYYSDFTFGVWTAIPGEGDVLVPSGRLTLASPMRNLRFSTGSCATIRWSASGLSGHSGPSRSMDLW